MYMLTDDTLREGLQTPGFSMKPDEKIKLASLISDAGVERALVSYPPAHISEVNVTVEIVKKKYFKETYALGRTVREDIDLIYSTGSEISLHLPFTVNNWDSLYDIIKYACSLDRKVELAFVDIDMFDIATIIKFALKMENLGVDVLQLPDTRGVLYPEKLSKIIKSVKNESRIKIEVHCHNDYGMAVPNTVAGISAGAEYVDTTIFGIGERNGIADSATIANYLISDERENNINKEKLKKAYDYVLELINTKIGPEFFNYNFPVYGKNCKTQTAGTHVASSNVFEWKNYSVNVYTGKSMIRNILNNLNFKFNENELGDIVNRIKDVSVESGNALKSDEIIKIAGEIHEKSH